MFQLTVNICCKQSHMILFSLKSTKIKCLSIAISEHVIANSTSLLKS